MIKANGIINFKNGFSSKRSLNSVLTVFQFKQDQIVNNVQINKNGIIITLKKTITGVLSNESLTFVEIICINKFYHIKHF